MDPLKQKALRRERRKKRVRKKVFGTAERPRLTVFRSLKHIYAQLIDDVVGRTLVEASTRSRELRDGVTYGGNVAAAAVVGQRLGEQALAQGIRRATLDRSGYKYHGRLKALAEAARTAGLKI